MPKRSQKPSASASSPRRRAASKKPPAAAPRRSRPKPPEPSVGPRGPRILVVDDEADQRTVLFHTLRMEGYEIAEAADGDEALAKIKRTPFDLVVLDIMMPRMSGYEVLDQIRTMPGREDTPVLVVTAKHDPSGLMREVRSGANDHIAKPYLPSELVGVVKELLTGSHEASERGRKLGHQADLYGTVSELHRQARDDG